MSTTITITDPAVNGDPFPNIVTGTYSNYPGLPTVILDVKNQGTGIQMGYTAACAPGPGGSGNWSLAKPLGLAPGVYTLIATLGTASDMKINILNESTSPPGCASFPPPSAPRAT